MQDNNESGYSIGSIITREPAERSPEKTIVAKFKEDEVTLNEHSVGKRFILVRDDYVIPVKIVTYNGNHVIAVEEFYPNGHMHGRPVQDPNIPETLFVIDPNNGVRAYPFSTTMIQKMVNEGIKFGPYSKGGKKKRKSKRRKSKRRKNTMKTQKRK